MDQVPDYSSLATGTAMGVSLVTNLISLALGIVMIIAMWKVFVKAGKPGWAAIIPIYNIVVLLGMVKRPVWWIVLFFIPIVNLVILIIVSMDLAESFGKSKVWGFFMLFILSFIGYLILGFGKDSYTEPARTV